MSDEGTSSKVDEEPNAEFPASVPDRTDCRSYRGRYVLLGFDGESYAFHPDEAAELAEWIQNAVEAAYDGGDAE